MRAASTYSPTPLSLIIRADQKKPESDAMNRKRREFELLHVHSRTWYAARFFSWQQIACDEQSLIILVLEKHHHRARQGQPVQATHQQRQPISRAECRTQAR